jgi:hypothetical protein
MAQNMSADEVKGLKEMFESMDTDKSGTCTIISQPSEQNCQL